jgi:hypothetical protein
MKRLVLVILTVLALTATGALLAQSPQNTTAPGPTTQRDPGQTNNNLPNPGNPQTQVGPGTTSGTTATGTQSTTSTTTTGTETTSDMVDTETEGTTTGLDNTSDRETGTGVDVDVDTGDRAAGAVDVDVDSTTDADTDASGIDETGGLDTETGAYDDQGTLPDTASNELMVALMGLIALGAALSVRAFSKQNA